jgi:hypothetical protein
MNNNAGTSVGEFRLNIALLSLHKSNHHVYTHVCRKFDFCRERLSARTHMIQHISGRISFPFSREVAFVSFIHALSRISFCTLKRYPPSQISYEVICILCTIAFSERVFSLSTPKNVLLVHSAIRSFENN